MKTKITLALLAAILIFCGFQYSNRQGNDIPGEQQMETLHYRGHTYICYRFYETGWKGQGGFGYGGASIIHDPDCKCRKGGNR